MLDRTLRDVMQPVVVVTADMTVAEALGKGSSADALVVIDSDVPSGVVSRTRLQAVPDYSVSVATYANELATPTLSYPDVTVRDLVDGMLANKDIRWHVVLEGGAIVGALPPELVLKAFAGETGATLGDISGTFGHSVVAAPTVCWRCSADASHSLRADEVQHWDVRGNALCHVHHDARMVRENPCQTKA